MNNSRVALVTGAAGAIGRAIAERLALQGRFEVCALDRSDGPLRAVVQRIVERGGRAVAYVADLSDESSLKEVCTTILSTHGKVDALVNNAAIGAVFPTEQYPEESWHTIIAVNLTAAFLLSQQFLPYMRESGWGRIINISSINGLRAGSGRLAYGTSKTALLGLTRQLAVDTAQWGITVNAIAPGAIRTPMLDAMAAGGGGNKEQILAYVPMNRFGTPEEVAGSVAFLISEEAAYITGHTLIIDGGFSAAGILRRNSINSKSESDQR